MKISGYKVLIMLGMLILHSLPFVSYNYVKNSFDKIFITIVITLLNIAIIGISEIYNDLFKKIDRLMKKEIKLW